MDTNRLKKFAVEARNKLKEGVAAKMVTLGFDRNGQVVSDRLQPQLMQGGSLWNGQLKTEAFYHQWMSLFNRIQQKGIKAVYEEAAYTWFNRLVAIRILQKNGLIEPVLDYVDQARTPRIVDEARMGRLPQMSEQQRKLIAELLDDDNRTTEQFALLVTAFCHDTPILYRCFGTVTDYTELLLPDNILTEGGFVDLLNNTPFITEEDYHSTELLGWLYQFYISERKDEVFAKKGKFEADEIPAATQIFTPNWIVKYMVQNTVGRIYLDNNPSASAEFKPKWQYLVEPSTPTPKDAIYKYQELTDLKMADLASGSGHILIEFFDILYDLYIYEGYRRREAIENILSKNLTGVDLDTRAKQLAQFALLLKACQKDASFADAHIMPRVLDMPEPYPYKDNLRDTLPHFFLGGNQNIIKEVIEAIKLMDQAKNLGSIMKFKISDTTRNAIAVRMEEYEKQESDSDEMEQLKMRMQIILALTEKYSTLVMNPPYMGGGNMNASLSKYVKDNYVKSKADLFAVFMDVAFERLAQNGKYGMINMHSWMFLSSFEQLRKSLLANSHIESLLHLGPRTFDELNGEVVQNAAFVICKPLSELSHTEDKNSTKGSVLPVQMACTNALYFSGIYFRLVDGGNCGDKERMFLDARINHTKEIYYTNIAQSEFEKIPGCPIGFWMNPKVMSIFTYNNLISSHSVSRAGFSTGNNAIFIREWFEVELNKIAFGLSNNQEYLLSSYKFVPFTAGGVFRKWYGNLEYVVDWSNPENMHRPRTTYMELYYKPAITWNAITSGNLSCRYYGKGFLFEHAAATLFVNENLKKEVFLAFLNSVVFQYLLKILNPTLNNGGDVVSSVPILFPDIDISEIVSNNISIAKSDWDAHETSWDFKSHPLLKCRGGEMTEEGEIGNLGRIPDYLEGLYDMYKAEWEQHFIQLHKNEEELNRQFIEIYGLQDELTPDVPLNEITILQQGEIRIEDNQLKWNADVVMKQLISYAVGCMMGRYSIDKPGLILANQGDGIEQFRAQVPNSQFEPDDDGIVPLMPANSDFSDNATARLKTWLATTFGIETQVDNLNFIEKALGKSVDDYFVKDFWKDHKKMYQNRPIYWLFSSKKGAFQCLVYMHRMDAYTAERIRSNYLLPYIEHLKHQIADLENRAATLSTTENRKLQNLQKTLNECQEYHERLQVVAEQAISFDLDDGVVVNYAKFGDVLAKIK